MPSTNADFNVDAYVDPNSLPTGYGNLGNLAYATPAQLAALGYTGPSPFFNTADGASAEQNQALGLQAFQQFLQDNAYKLGTTDTGDQDNNYVDQYSQNGVNVGPSETHEN